MIVEYDYPYYDTGLLSSAASFVPFAATISLPFTAVLVEDGDDTPPRPPGTKRLWKKLCSTLRSGELPVAGDALTGRA